MSKVKHSSSSLLAFWAVLLPLPNLEFSPDKSAARDQNYYFLASFAALVNLATGTTIPTIRRQRLPINAPKTSFLAFPPSAYFRHTGLGLKDCFSSLIASLHVTFAYDVTYHHARLDK